MAKIRAEDVAGCDKSIFGAWLEDDSVKVTNAPFKHILIDDFLRPEAFRELIAEHADLVSTLDDGASSSSKDNTKSKDDTELKKEENGAATQVTKKKFQWWKYHNPLEVKLACDAFDTYPERIHNLFAALCTEKVCKKLEKIFGFTEPLTYDPCMHGAGLHLHPRHGRLLPHLDYEKHPLRPTQQRRLNIIFYLNENWKKEWNGATELWDRDVVEDCLSYRENLKQKGMTDQKLASMVKSEGKVSLDSSEGISEGIPSLPAFDMEKGCVESHPFPNRALIFETSDLSWHGVSKRIMCPEGEYRKTMAMYYLTDLVAAPSERFPGTSEAFGKMNRDTLESGCVVSESTRASIVSESSPRSSKESVEFEEIERKLYGNTEAGDKSPEKSEVGSPSSDKGRFVSKHGAGEDGFRTKACFVQRPDVPGYDERLEELLRIRPLRRIEPADMERLWPEWTHDLMYDYEI